MTLYICGEESHYAVFTNGIFKDVLHYVYKEKIKQYREFFKKCVFFSKFSNYVIEECCLGCEKLETARE